MNRSFVAFIAVASTGFILVMSTQISRSAQSGTSPTLNAGKVSAAKPDAKANGTNTATRSQPHRLAVQVNVNDPATMNLALNNVSNAARHYSELGQKVEIEVVAFGPAWRRVDQNSTIAKSSPAVILTRLEM
jgi:uncharacterized protein